jgi:magnesium transporter
MSGMPEPTPGRGSLGDIADTAGLPPGTLTHVGQRRSETVTLHLIAYDAEHVCEEAPTNIEATCASFGGPIVSWLNVCGLHDPEIVERIGRALGLHPLVLEDVLNTLQRPKMEDLGSYLLIELEMLAYDEAQDDIAHEQVSVILGRHYVLSFQEAQGDLFDPIRERIRTAKGRIRELGADFAAYLLIDAVVDHYFVLLEQLGDRIEDVEDEMLASHDADVLARIHDLKRQLILVRKSVWPLREAIGGLERAQSPLFDPTTRPYLRDLYEHTIQVIDTVETYRDMLSGLMDLHLSSLSNHMNEIMKVLTIISTLFIPLTFIAGVYGMNFRFMPELGWRWAYPLVWLIMLALVVVMLAYFRRRRWL